MKFVTFTRGAAQAVGLWLDDKGVLDLPLAAELAGETLDASSMIALIAGGDAALKAVRALAARPPEDAIYPASEVTLLAPIPRPAKNVFCVGRNYLEHVHEGDRMFDRQASLPTAPNFFTKAPTTVTGPDSPVRYPSKITQAFDYEIELGVIIGKAGRDIPRDKALEHVFGYTIINDMSARDLQRAEPQWIRGKSLDTFGPLGPVVLDAQSAPPIGEMRIRTHVNGELRQDVG